MYEQHYFGCWLEIVVGNYCWVLASGFFRQCCFTKKAYGFCQTIKFVQAWLTKS